MIEAFLPQSTSDGLFAGVESLFGVPEHGFHPLDIPWMFDQGFMIPFASGFVRREKVTAIDMNGARHFPDRIEHGMDRGGIEYAYVSRSE